MKGTCVLDNSKKIIKIDKVGCSLLGSNSRELIGFSITDIILQVDMNLNKKFIPLNRTWASHINPKRKIEFNFSNCYNQIIKATCTPTKVNNDSNVFYKISLQSTSDQLLHSLENENNHIYKIIHLINSSDNLQNFLKEFILFIKDIIGIESVTVKLRTNHDLQNSVFPILNNNFTLSENDIYKHNRLGYNYVHPKSFSFFHCLCSSVAQENSSCIKKRIECNHACPQSFTFSDCLCGAVVQGNIDNNLPCFTKGGSFWTNYLTELVNKTEIDKNKFFTQNTCSLVGHESVALIPIKNAKSVYGLIQLTDHRTSMFNDSFIMHFENITEILSVALQIKFREERLENTSQTLNKQNKLLNGLSIILSTIYRHDIKNDSKFHIIRKALIDIIDNNEHVDIHVSLKEYNYSSSTSRNYKFKLCKNIYYLGTSIGRIEYYFHESYHEIRNHNYLNLLDNFLDIIVIELEKYFEKEQIEIEKKRTELFFASVWKHSNNALRISDTKGIIIAVNDSFCQLIGAEMYEMVGRNISSLYCDLEEFNNCEYNFGNYDLDNIQLPTNRIQCKAKFYTNKTVFVDITYTIMVNNDGQKLILSTFRDNTSYVLTKSELLKSEKLAAIGEMSSFLNHEIRSYLNPIKLNLDIVEKKVELPLLEMKLFRQIKSQINRMERLLKEVRQFSNTSEIKLCSINLSELIDNLFLFLQPTLERKMIKSINHISKLLIIKGDFEKLQSVFLHLIENSIESIEYNGEILVFSNINSVDNTLRIYITDTGCGIGNEASTKIFEPFFTTKNTGTGIGLALVSKYLRMHNASIELTSSKPGETIFLISFPKYGICDGNNTNH